MPKNDGVVDLDAKTLRNKVYEIRGQKVMLDYDLADIYGYTTKAFNQQVKNNLKKFEGEDFMFRLTWDEAAYCLRSKNLTSNNNGRGGNRYAPYAFTEQGIYMLMTVLRGELATKQSRTLIRLFKTMKDYIAESQEQLAYRDNLQIAMLVAENAQDIKTVKSELNKVDIEMRKMSRRLDDAITKSDLPVIFDKIVEQREFVLLNGQLMKATELYTDLFARAKRSIYIIDDYISIKTLRHLQKVKPGVKVTVFSDNKGNYLHQSDYLDCLKEYPGLDIAFIKTGGLVHDRFIILDYNDDNEVIYHCGGSAKDAGGRMTAISKFDDKIVQKLINEVMERLMRGEKLRLQ